MLTEKRVLKYLMKFVDDVEACGQDHIDEEVAGADPVKFATCQAAGADAWPALREKGEDMLQ